MKKILIGLALLTSVSAFSSNDVSSTCLFTMPDGGAGKISIASEKGILFQEDGSVLANMECPFDVNEESYKCSLELEDYSGKITVKIKEGANNSTVHLDIPGMDFEQKTYRATCN